MTTSPKASRATRSRNTSNGTGAPSSPSASDRTRLSSVAPLRTGSVSPSFLPNRAARAVKALVLSNWTACSRAECESSSRSSRRDNRRASISTALWYGSSVSAAASTSYSAPSSVTSARTSKPSSTGNKAAPSGTSGRLSFEARSRMPNNTRTCVGQTPIPEPLSSPRLRMESLNTENAEDAENTEGSGMWLRHAIKGAKGAYAMCVLFVEAQSASKKFQTLHFRNDNRLDVIPTAREYPSVFSASSVSSVANLAETDARRFAR